MFSTEITVLDKWLPIEAVRIILHLAENLGRKQNDAGSLDRKPFFMEVVSTGSGITRSVSAEPAVSTESENWRTTFYRYK